MTDRISELTKKGYRVEARPSSSDKFNERYAVYMDTKFGRRYCLLDESGKIKGHKYAPSKESL